MERPADLIAERGTVTLPSGRVMGLCSETIFVLRPPAILLAAKLSYTNGGLRLFELQDFLQNAEIVFMLMR